MTLLFDFFLFDFSFFFSNIIAPPSMKIGWLLPPSVLERGLPSLFGNMVFIHIQTKTEIIIVDLNPIWPMSTIFLKGHLDLETDTDGGQYEDTQGVWHLRQKGSPCLQGQARAAGWQPGEAGRHRSHFSSVFCCGPADTLSSHSQCPLLYAKKLLFRISQGWYLLGQL